MNLNFYNPGNLNNLENLQTNLQEQLDKLNSLNSLQSNPSKIQQPLKEQRYYLDCGKKEDWTEFLRINYNITEEQIFEDYKLFLQAKAELNEDANKEKLENMKQKISSPRGKERGNVKPNIQPEPAQQYTVQPVPSYGQPIYNEQLVPVQPSNNVQQYTPTNLPVPMPMSEQNSIVNAGDTTINSNELVESTNSNKLANNTKNIQSKGVKHVR